MSHETLAIIWFCLLGVLLAGYAILDGFDLGVGILHPLLPRGEAQKRVSVQSIGPLWDGNEVWLITFGGALFAAFPEGYASIFSGFYTAFHLVLVALILRAVSLEFRSKVESQWWRRLWDGGFFLGSVLTSLLFGVAVGNAILGLPLNERGEYLGTIVGQLRLYPLMVGVLTVTMFAMHGSIFLYLKTGGTMQQRAREFIWHTFGLFLVMYMLTTIYTLSLVPEATGNFHRFPWAAGVVVLNVLAIANIPRCIYRGQPGQAFASSCATILAFVFLFSLALYPNLLTASDEPAHSVTLFNAASSPLTLTVMLIIASIGMPLVLAYTAAVYYTFWGKVESEGDGY